MTSPLARSSPDPPSRTRPPPIPKRDVQLYMLRPLPNNLWTGPTSGRRAHTQVSGTGFRARQLLIKWVGETSIVLMIEFSLLCFARVLWMLKCSRCGVFGCVGVRLYERKPPPPKCGSAGSDAKLRQRGLQGAGMTSCSCKRVCVCVSDVV